MENNQEQQLWELAKQRAAFKKSITSYVLVNTFLVGIWYFTSGRHHGHFWPIWPMLGWGLGLGIQYVNAYHGTNIFSTEKEFENLKRKNQQQ